MSLQSCVELQGLLPSRFDAYFNAEVEGEGRFQIEEGVEEDRRRPLKDGFVLKNQEKGVQEEKG